MSSEWGNHPDIDIEALNEGLVAGEPTVDCALYYPDNLDPSHHALVNVELLVDGFLEARDVFGEAGVQLRLVWFKTGHLDPSLFAIRASKDGRESPMGRFVNLYVDAERRTSVISDEAAAAFAAIIGDPPGSDRIIHLITLQEVYMDFFEPVEEHRVHQARVIETGGLSFPGYMYGDTIPRAWRGVITLTNLTRTQWSWKTIAHEIGHKLLNVSHEYREISPQHEVQADGGLMLYGKGTDIPSGIEGRFHLERLHRSPYLYTVSEDGTRVYNRDYEGAGFYYDPIYEGISVEFDPDP